MGSNFMIKNLVILIVLASAGVASAREVGTAEGSSNEAVHACQVAKEDAQRQARNARAVVTGYASCVCKEEKAYSKVYCTVDFQMEEKKKDR
ncbi:MAG TPA: hypothetical protein VJ654_19295 [Noviherbaspirillum sp.]|nr:hypothetical protein [Noviherbaspirillum sp.]